MKLIQTFFWIAFFSSSASRSALAEHIPGADGNPLPSHAAEIASDTIALGCTAIGQKSALVATNLRTGEATQIATFQGGGFSAWEATRQSSETCLTALSAQYRCRHGRSRIFGCQANGQESDLVVADLQTGRKTTIGSFQGGGFWAATAERMGAENCLRALVNQATCP